MSKLTDELRSKAIFNSHDFAYAKGVQNENYSFERPTPPKIEGVPRRIPMIYYRKADHGRGGWSAYWAVAQFGIDLNPTGHWHFKDYHGGKAKDFHVWGRDNKKEQFEAALAWAKERFGIEEWAKDPWGIYMPAAFVKARLKQLKEFDPTS